MSGGSSAQNRLAPVLSAVDKLEALLSEIPSEFIPEFENAAKELFAGRREQLEAGEDDANNADESAGPKAKKQKVQESDGERIKAVQCWLREKVPVEAVMPSENLIFEHKGTEFADYTAHNTASVDGFLYDEGDIDELCDQGKLARNYCCECGSRNTAPLNFISHSLSIPEIRFLVQTALPAVCKTKDCTLLDVGSRLGAVLYGASILGDFKRVTGIEINADLTKVQSEAVAVFGLSGHVSVTCGDIKEHPDLVANAQVVVLHNAFQFFLAPEESLRCWQTIARATVKGTVIVACPSLEEQLACCAGGGDGDDKSKKKKKKKKSAVLPLPLEDWVEEVQMQYPLAEDEGDEYADEEGRLFSNIRLYRVRAPLPPA